MENLWQDLRYGVRMLAKKPAFTAVAVIALALGIGANSAIFSVINAVLLRPLPFKDPERLVTIWHNYPQINLPQAVISAPSYVDYRDNIGAFEQIAVAREWSVNLTGAGEPERVDGALVTASFFPTLGVEPARGRGFYAEEDRPGSNNVVIISDGLWKRRFGADPSVVGGTVTLNGAGYTVVGIMPAGFVLIQEVDVWSPIAFTPEQLAPDNHGYESLLGLARLKDGVTLEQAQAEADALAVSLREQFYPPSWGISLVSLGEQLVGDIRPALLILLGAVGSVLLIACANVANLLLARATARQKEIAVRTALGASRWRIVRQLLTESVLLSIAGGALGLLLAFLGVRLLVAGIPQEIARYDIGWRNIGIDFWVLGFTFGVAVLTGVIFGLAPSLQASKLELTETLKEGGRGGSDGRRHNRLRGMLVMLEVAATVVLLIGAGLLIRSFLRLQEVSPGFDAQNVLTMQVALPRSKYSENHQVTAFYDQALQRIRSLPGVTYAGIVDNIPMGNMNSNATFFVEGQPIGPGEAAPHGDPHMVDTDYFNAMGIPLLKGRYFDRQDTKDSLPVAIIDETLASRYWPDEDPLGKRIAVGFEGGQNNRLWRQVVGVVGYVKQYGLEGKSKVQYYFPHTQRPSRFMYFVTRSSSDPSALIASVRGAIQSVDPDQPVHKVMTMSEVLSNSMTQRRFSMFLLAIFASVALVLAAVGIYGVMSYSVTQRTHEIGIRLALGAQGGDVLRMVLGQGLIMTLVGVGLGLGLALVLTRIMSSLLFGVSATDPLTFAGIPIVLTAVATIASYVPARRALKVDPMVALRYE